jgi:Carboxypeptidase regulatory-like domain
MLRWLFLALSESLAIAQINPNTTLTATIAGRVITADGGSPVRKAHVSLSQYRRASAIELVATTDENGRFRFADVEPGTYTLLAEKSGYLPGANGQQDYGDQESILKIDAGQEVSDISLRVFPASAIEGQVLDGDGDPASGCKVLLWSIQSRHNVRVHDDTVTDRDGRYHFESLQPGTYLVSADANSEDEDSTKQIRVDSAGKRTICMTTVRFFPQH